MIKNYSILWMIALIVLLTHCDLKNETEKESNDLKSSDNQNLKLESSQGDHEFVSAIEKSSEENNPGNSDSKKLDEIIEKIEKLDNKISTLEIRVTNLERGETSSGNYKADKKKQLKTLNKQITKLKNKLQKKVSSAQKLIKNLSKKKRKAKYRYKSKYRTYRLYIGAFELYENALKRKRHISHLGVPTRILGKSHWKDYNNYYKSNYWDPVYGKDYSWDPIYGYDSRDANYPYNNGYNETDYNYYKRRSLYKIVSKYKYHFKKAIKLTNYLMSRGYETYIRRSH